ncbi:MAG: NfeD family protein [Agathobacter sp.]|nr:NfeD family protein [Agathobacter sp.]
MFIIELVDKLGYDISAWLLLLILFICVELVTVGLTSIWFAAGAFTALIFAMIGLPFPVQVLVFIIVSVALLVVTRPIAAKYLNSRVQKTNVDSLIGTKCYVTECVNNINQTGKAVVNGLDWTVRADDDREIINQGELVEIVRVCGVKLIVRKVKEDKLWKEN